MTSLKLLVNKEKNQVLYAESDNEFVDFLFSFLTIPLGSTPCRSNIGCLGTLWQSVQDFDTPLLQTSDCKNMLRHPNSALGSTLCKNLKVNIVGSDPTYYLCPSCTGSPKSHNLVSTSSSTLCRCGAQMSRSVQRKNTDVADGKDGSFVKGNLKFLITDDLQVSPVSTLTSLALINKLDVSDTNVLEVRNVYVGHIKVKELLTSLFISKTPLTDVFLGKQNTQHGTELNPQDMVDQIENDNDDKSKRMNLKLLLSKSSNKVLYAESGEEFPDLLLSFLTFPLGSVVKLLGGKTGMGCLDNLYKSVQDLSLQDCVKSEARTTMLLAPKLAPYFGTKNQLLKIEEQLPWKPILFHCTGCESYNNGYYIANGGNECPHGKKGTELSIVNPKCRDGAHEPGGSFVAGPAKFVVTDELTVQRLSPVSGISLINKFSFPISDLEEVVVSVGEMVALSLLRAFLKSKTVLSDVFYSRKSNHSRKRSSDHEMSETDKRTRFEI